MTPEGIRRLLDYAAQKATETMLRFDLQMVGPGESFEQGWPRHLALPPYLGRLCPQIAFQVWAGGRN